MKRLLLFSLAMLVSVASFAQMKGEMFIAGTIAAEFGSMKTTLTEGGYSASASQPLSSSFSIGAEYGYFVADNVRLAMSLSVPCSSSPAEEDDGKWLKDKAVSFVINPSAAYYWRLTDRLFYTPEAGAAIKAGAYKEQLSASEIYRTPYTGWNVYLNFFAFEYRFAERFALGILAGAIGYGSEIYRNIDTEAKATINQFKFNLNNSRVQFRYYF